MMIERNEFRIKFGKMKDALALWNEILTEFKNAPDKLHVRVLTDLTGPAYTLVLEIEIRDFIHLGFKNYQWMTKTKVGELYQKFVPLCESSVRTLYKVESEI
ncbi:MAG: hypothetical protein K0Q79_3140 [Flavipsychrobacter sp.]|jgi:hypothetical protein|nr:hypothetical protein [Flavipsychrobacter sp.]